MNREQKRSLKKKVLKAGGTAEQADNIVDIAVKADKVRAGDTGVYTPPQEIREGEKVRLNLPAIKSRKNWENMLPKYHSFVESNEETVFTAHIMQENVISFVEEPVWLFWSGDLIRVEPDEAPAEEPES